MLLLGIFLVYTGYRLAAQGDDLVRPGENKLVRLVRRLAPVPDALLVVLAIESTDLLFATDSIPAIFAVTTDPFIVYTSNIFAVLGLRAMYFVLAGVLGGLAHLRVGLAVVLMFVGAKMLLAPWVQVPVGATLAVVAGVLAVAAATPPSGNRDPRGSPA